MFTVKACDDIKKIWIYVYVGSQKNRIYRIGEPEYATSMNQIWSLKKLRTVEGQVEVNASLT